MNILNVDNKVYSINNLPADVEEINFSVLDNSSPSHPDFYFIPLIFLESFNSPAIVLDIGGYEITMPIDWSIAVGDRMSGCDVEILPLTSLNDRGFDAFCYNPVNGFRLDYKTINIVNFYSDVKWYFPKLKQNQLLTVPLTFEDNPPCAFFIKEVTRQSEIIDLSKLL